MRSIKQSHIESVEKHLPHSEDKAISLHALSKRMRCSYMAAKRRLYKYAELNGVKLHTTFRREGTTGPESVCYYAE